ncbi:MAG: hypothetical protein U1B80_04395 [Anaerolineaceae bacterium]|nr:hypothetical protein [Anaerolineaceae bacterium]
MSPSDQPETLDSHMEENLNEQPSEEAQPPISAPEPEEEKITTPPPAPPRPAAFKRVLHFLFSSETRVGRFIRPALRWSALVVAMFALGVLATYLLLYRPAQGNLNAARQSLATAETLLSESKAELAANALELNKTASEKETLEAALETATERIHLLKTLHLVNTARIALRDEDIPTAQSALRDAKAQLELLLPVIEKDDPELAKALSLRLELAAGGIERDLPTALADLDILSSSLALLDKTLSAP